MSKKLQGRNQWRELLQRQSIANVNHWLEQIEQSSMPEVLIAKEYENLLRALENIIENPENLSLTYKLIETLHSTVVDFADWDRWLIYLKKAFQQCERNQDFFEAANLSVQIGEVSLRMGLREEAETAFKKGAGIFLQLNQQASYVSTLTKLGILYDLQGDMNEGIRLCQKALTVAQEIGDQWVIAEAYLNLSYIYYRARNWEASLTAVQSAYEFYNKLHRPKEATKALFNIIAISAEMGDWDKVEPLSQQLVEKLRVLEDVRTMNQLKNILGVVAYSQANYRLAESYWQEALTLQTQIQELSEIASLYNNLGMAYTKLNEEKTAEEMLKKAINAYFELGDIYHWANSLDNLADLYESQGNKKAFYRSLKLAIDGMQTIKDRPHALELLNQMQNRIK